MEITENGTGRPMPVLMPMGQEQFIHIGKVVIT